MVLKLSCSTLGLHGRYVSHAYILDVYMFVMHVNVYMVVMPTLLQLLLCMDIVAMVSMYLVDVTICDIMHGN